MSNYKNLVSILSQNTTIKHKVITIYILIITKFVRTSFGLDSKIGMDSGPISPNNKFIERGRKNKVEFRKDVTIVDGLEEYLNE